MMKAAIYRKYGPPEVLQMAEVPRPVQKENELLVRNFASSVNSADWKLRKASPAVIRLFTGLINPRKQILGAVYAGVVEKAGSKVTVFQEGDRVFGMTGLAMGAYAAYVRVGESSPVACIPDGISFVEAAAVPFGATAALHFLQKARLQKDQSVFIYGASGAVGSAAIQLAKYLGARVTAVCSGANKELVLSLGADRHIDYTTYDFSSPDEQYDVVFETVNKLPFIKALGCLKRNGVLLLGSAGVQATIQGMFTNIRGGRKVISGLAMEKPEEMRYIQNLMTDGFFKPVIDRVYPIEQIAEAHRYAEAGHKKGNVVVEIGNALQ